MKIIFVLFTALLSLNLFASGGALLGGGNSIPFVTPTLNDCLVGTGSAWVAGSCSTGTGTVTSVGLGVPSIFTAAGTPVTTTGTLSFSLNSQLQNLFLASPNGSSGTPSFRSILGADLPNPGASSLGGVNSKASISHNFLTQIGTDGTVSQAQPAFSDISGSANLTSQVTGVLPIANGGTNYSTPLNNNRIIQSLTGTMAEAVAITPARALISDSTGIPTHSAVTGVELGYSSGVTSAIQTQINGKAPSNGSGIIEEFTGHIIAPANYTYILDQSAAYAYTINTFIAQTSAGTITCAIQIGGTNVTGLSAVSLSSSPATGTASGLNSVSVGNRVTMVCSSNSSSADLSFTLKVTR